MLLVRTRGQPYVLFLCRSKEYSAKRSLLFPYRGKIDFDCAVLIELRQVAKYVRDNLPVLAGTVVGLRQRNEWEMARGCATASIFFIKRPFSTLWITLLSAGEPHCSAARSRRFTNVSMCIKMAQHVDRRVYERIQAFPRGWPYYLAECEEVQHETRYAPDSGCR